MKVIVVEDEILAAERLVNLIHRYDKEIEVLAVLDSITSSLEWLKNNEAPDLGFFDIQLADGLSLDIFEKIDLNFPVIFTTAYDEYALKAFKTNGIDYLLKPISLEELDSAFQKYVTLRQSLGSDVKK
ncbi:MAG: response regulator [Bacteroidota bacterium]